MMSQLSKGLSGVAGEYFVAAELSRRGYIASITLRNSKGVDILATGEDDLRSVNIQVKTNQNSNKSWLLSRKAESVESETLFYVFVSLNGPDGTPDYHVVQSSAVARWCRDSHRNWLSEPGRGGHVRKDTSMRQFQDPENWHLNKWEVLRLEPVQ